LRCFYRKNVVNIAVAPNLLGFRQLGSGPDPVLLLFILLQFLTTPRL